ncbi:MAG: PCRF domain-containing protein, partial [Lentisphaeria bacterium]|nr:PCRF domain-containing protein [Lentisphaeria bacterium]
MKLDTYIANATNRFREVEQAIAAFTFSPSKQGQYQALNREYQRLKRLLTAWSDNEKAQEELAGNRELLDSEQDAEFREVVENDIAELEARAERLDREIKTLILPPHANEGRNVIVEIRPAAGGDEAGLFASDLFRMYSRFAEDRGWKIEVLDIAENAVGGFKNVSFSIQGD